MDMYRLLIKAKNTIYLIVSRVRKTAKVAFGLCLLFALISVPSCEKIPKQSHPIRPVITETVKYTTSGPPLVFSGFSKSEKMINLSFRVKGLIEKLPIKVGEKLEKGQLIAKLDDHDYILELQRSNAALEEALADARKSSAQYKRIKALYESESASRDELDTARAAHEAAKAAVEKAESMVELAEQQLSYTTLIAEGTNCEVSSKKSEINENVDAGQVIATLACGRKLEVEIAVPENFIAQINENDHVDVHFNALSGMTFHGYVSEVGVQASGGTTFPVTVVLHDRHDELRSGMAVKAVVYTENKDKKPIILVPIEAVGKENGHNFVYVYEGDEELGTVKRKQVTIGQLRPGGFTISSGLEPGEKVIVAGLRFLQDGKKVRLLSAKPSFMKRK
ncbi:MAG: Efflux pump periplasmic linker BepF [Chlamydiia bacterium]|nr:Efflux pump periplasmic linker BepF [Chlamydiia bacterium]